MTQVDLVVVGGGIIGLATARAALVQQPGLRVRIIEKEDSVAHHQTGRNSGVIHAGVYYKPGSAKARLCVEGREQMVQYCRDHGLKHEICGKLVVAVEEEERERLEVLHQRCLANGVPVERLGVSEMREIEPHVSGISAIHIKATGIVNYGEVSCAIADEIRGLGAEINLGMELLRVDDRGGSIQLTTTGGEISTRRVVNCAGLHADRVAQLFDVNGARGMKIIPFRGEYFELSAAKNHLVKTLIYPVPNPLFPFLGVHLTRGINGHIHAGPNAVLALAREGYTWLDVSGPDLIEYLRFSGFQKLARKHWRYGLSEMARSMSKHMFARALARLVPEIRQCDLVPSSSGVRAQAVHADGRLAEDFELNVTNQGRVLHVLNAPSPAATASFAIGEQIAKELL